MRTGRGSFFPPRVFLSESFRSIALALGEAEALLCSSCTGYLPRPTQDTVPWAVYVETSANGNRRPNGSDRWRNSGGVKGSVLWPAVGPRLRRKYGTVTKEQGDKLLFIEYTDYFDIKKNAANTCHGRSLAIYQALPGKSDSSSASSGRRGQVPPLELVQLKIYCACRWLARLSCVWGRVATLPPSLGANAWLVKAWLTHRARP